MSRNFVWFLLLSGLLCICCKPEKKEAGHRSQMKEVMAIHDEVMPKMGTIGKLVAELKPRVDSTETGRDYERAMKDLQEAHGAMMEWMQEFGSRFDSEEILKEKPLTDQKQRWLDEEEEKVNALKEQINGSIARAEELLKSRD